MSFTWNLTEHPVFYLAALLPNLPWELDVAIWPSSSQWNDSESDVQLSQLWTLKTSLQAEDSEHLSEGRQGQEMEAATILDGTSLKWGWYHLLYGVVTKIQWEAW